MNMAIGYFGVMPDKYGTKRPWGSFPRFDLPERIAAPIFTPVAFTVDATIGSIIFISRLFRRVCRRLMIRCQRIVQSGRNQIHDRSQTRIVPSGPTPVGSVSKATLPLEIVRMIAQDAHHVDLTSVSRSSRLLRTSFFGELDVKARLDGLKDFTCDSGRSSCDICRSQICPVSAGQSPWGIIARAVFLRPVLSIFLVLYGQRPPGRKFNDPPPLQAV